MRAYRVQKTAEICGLETASVYRVLRGERVNEKVMSVFMTISEQDNKLLSAVKELVEL